jgi:hypothetical protein
MKKMTTSATAPAIAGLLPRVRAEYLEMPGLCLTKVQAQRLWSLDGPTCDTLLAALTEARFLRRTDRGAYIRDLLD